MPTSLRPSTTGIPEMRYCSIICKTSAMRASGPMVTGSTIIPDSDFFTFSASGAWAGMDRLRCRMPIPPWRAREMAVSASVTVSMAELNSGMLRLMRRVRRVLRSTSLGSTAEAPGSNRRSSKV